MAISQVTDRPVVADAHIGHHECIMQTAAHARAAAAFKNILACVSDASYPKLSRTVPVSSVPALSWANGAQ